MSDVDVVIVNYRSAAHTAACVAAARDVAQGDGVSITVTVVNNGDAPDALARGIGAENADIIHNPANLGFGAACNIGAARGAARLILFLNPDARLKPGYFKTTTAFMDAGANRDVGIVGPAIENEQGRVVDTCSPLPSISGLLARSVGLTSGFHVSADGPVGQVMGAVLMIRRPLFERLGGFDPRFFLYYEDVDLCARAAAMDAATYYLSAAHAVHAGRASSSQDTGMALALFLRSRFTYARLHFGVWAEGAVVLTSYLAELPLRLVRTVFGGKSITGFAVLRAYRLLTLSLLSRTAIPALAAQPRERS